MGLQHQHRDHGLSSASDIIRTICLLLPDGLLQRYSMLLRNAAANVVANVETITRRHHTLIMLKASSSSPDKIATLRKCVAYPGSEGPVVGLQNMSAKFPSGQNPSRLLIPLDATLHRRMGPVAPNIPCYSRKKISVPVTKCISQLRKRAKLDVRAMRDFKLGKCWAVKLGDSLIVLLRRQDHPLFQHLSIDTPNEIGAQRTLIKYTNMTAMPNLDAVSMPLIRAHSSATK